MNLLQYLLDVTIIWTILWLVFYTFLRKDTFFQSNRSYLLGATVAGLLLPLLRELTINTSLIQSSEFILYPISAAIHLDEPIAAQDISTGIFNWTNLLYLTYSLGLLFSFMRFFKGLLAIYYLHMRGSKKRLGACTIILTDVKHLPFSFYKWIYWSKSFHPDQIDEAKILAHESVHISQSHTLDVLWMEILGILFWWHPLIYLYKKAIRENHEYICDFLAGKEYPSYQRLLVQEVSENHLQQALTNQFFNRQIKNRIGMLNRERSSRWLLTKRLAIIPAIFVIVSMLAFRAEQTEDQPILMTCMDRQTTFDQQLLCTKKLLLEIIYSSIIYPKKARTELISGKAVLGLTFNREGLISYRLLQDENGQFAGAFESVIKSLRNLQFDLPQDKQQSFSIPVHFVLDGVTKENQKSFNAQPGFPSLIGGDHITVVTYPILEQDDQINGQLEKSSLIKKTRNSTGEKNREKHKALETKSNSILADNIIVENNHKILSRGLDYEVDEDAGKIRITNESVLKSNLPVSVSFKTETLPILSSLVSQPEAGSAFSLPRNKMPLTEKLWVYVYEASGELLHTRLLSQDELDAYDSHAIEKMVVLKGASVTAKYGTLKPARAVEIHLKSNGPGLLAQHDTDLKVSERAEVNRKDNAQNNLTAEKLCDNLQVFPNPTQDLLNFTIEGPHSGIRVRYYIVDLSGKLIGEQDVIQIHGQLKRSIDTGRFSPGQYFFVVEEPSFKHQKAFQIR